VKLLYEIIKCFRLQLISALTKQSPDP